MNGIEDLVFVKKTPKPSSARTALSPTDKARKKLLAELDAQIALAQDPEFVVKSEQRKRGTGEIKIIERKPRSWVVKDGDLAFITVRLLNKPLPLGGKKGSIIKCKSQDVAATLQKVRSWAASEQSTALLTKAIGQARRKSKPADG